MIVGGTSSAGPGDYTRTCVGALFLTVLTTVLIGHGASAADDADRLGRRSSCSRSPPTGGSGGCGTVYDAAAAGTQRPSARRRARPGNGANSQEH